MVGGVTAVGHVTDGPRAFLVFNPTAWPRDEVVRATVWDVEAGAPGESKKSFVVRLADGRTLPAQRVEDGNYWGHTFVELAFPLPVGGLGYAACVVEEGDAPAPKGGVTCGAGFRGGERQPVGDFLLENEHIAVAFDRATGGIVRLLDKATGRNLASPDAPTALLEYLVERPRGMTAWIIGDPKERRCPLAVDTFDPGLAGPYVGSMVARLRVNDSTIKVTYALKAGQPWLDVTVEAHWLEIGTRDKGVPGLRMRLPLALAGAKARYEIPFGSIARTENRGEEVPALRWADVTGRTPDGKAAGCALLNDSKYGHSLDGSTLSLTLIRSSYDPDPLPEIGDHAVHMGLVPHGKDLAPADLVRLGAGLNHPLMVVGTDVHAAALPPAATSVTAAPANVVVSSVRQAEDGSGLVFHLFETAGRKAAAKVTLDATVMGRPAEAVEVDLLERPLAASGAKATKDGFAVTVPAHGIAAVKVAFGE